MNAKSKMGAPAFRVNRSDARGPPRARYASCRALPQNFTQDAARSISGRTNRRLPQSVPPARPSISGPPIPIR